MWDNGGGFLYSFYFFPRIRIHPPFPPYSLWWSAVEAGPQKLHHKGREWGHWQLWSAGGQVEGGRKGFTEVCKEILEDKDRIRRVSRGACSTLEKSLSIAATPWTLYGWETSLTFKWSRWLKWVMSKTEEVLSVKAFIWECSTTLPLQIRVTAELHCFVMKNNFLHLIILLECSVWGWTSMGNGSLQEEMHTIEKSRRKKCVDFLTGHIEKVRQIVIYYSS